MPFPRPVLRRVPLLLAALLLFGTNAIVDAAPKAGSKRSRAVPVVIVSTPPTCTDFYAQANAEWLKSHPAPVLGSVSAFDAMYANARSQERTLLEEMAKNPGDDASRALGTLWTDGTNDAAVDAAGATPL